MIWNMEIYTETTFSLSQIHLYSYFLPVIYYHSHFFLTCHHLFSLIRWFRLEKKFPGTGSSIPLIVVLIYNILTWYMLTNNHLRSSEIYRDINYIKYISIYMGFLYSSPICLYACNAGDLGSRRSTGEEIGYPLRYSWASIVAQLVKNLPAMWKTWVQSLSWGDPLEKGKATHYSILAWRIPFQSIVSL